MRSDERATPLEPVSAGLPDLAIRRRRRFGKDRLYVTAGDGARLGWCDLITGERVIEVAQRRDEVDRAIECWVSDHDTVPGPSATIEPAAPQHLRSVRTLLARMLGIHFEERAWRLGERGEVLVAEQLAKLGGAWNVLHSVPVGRLGADIDHLVIGPGGVFTLCSKYHRHARVWVEASALVVNGYRQPYIRDSRLEAEHASRLLTAASRRPIGASGVVVIAGADSLTIKEQPQGVHVVARRRVVSWLSSLPMILQHDEVEEIVAVAREPATWQSLPGHGAPRARATLEAQS